MDTMDPHALVDEVEAVYQAQDADRIVELFDPDVVTYWNGRKRWEGLADLREHHAEPIAAYPAFEMEKTLRAASDETIAVEWVNRWTDTDGARHVGFGGEFWTMRDERLLEWHAYHRRYDSERTAKGDGAFLGHH
jgi:nuclear transport factor 2 (NTF2) superfamily protein